VRLALIGTFYRRWDRDRDILWALRQQERQADEHWLICEDALDARELIDAMYVVSYIPPGLRLVTLPTPTDGQGYTVIPYSHKINWVLDRSEADAFAYLDNGSLPATGKYAAMAAGLEEHPAVYVGQHRTGKDDAEHRADRIVEDAYCILNYTQVAHRRTADRWPLDMALAQPYDLADATFWRSLHESLGAFHPVGAGILDEHRIDGYAAVGL
jgi:hypothetical protein